MTLYPAAKEKEKTETKKFLAWKKAKDRKKIFKNAMLRNARHKNGKNA